ncbi:MAG: FKBP-type peptidyl-prolyl cis-trans isomerase [Verrucomicrobia bacterium]|nr:FKBP-type peptidyl-prolyl cis-trans isomerase [Verrucomicrobiota bacterium]
MKSFLVAVLVAASSLASLRAADKPALPDKNAQISYSVGVNIGQNWKQQDYVEFDAEQVLKGIKDALSGAKLLMTEQEMRDVLAAYRTEHRVRQEEKRKQLGDKNKLEASKFLAENKTKPGIVTLPSGLQYKVLTAGNGPTPSGSDTVTVHYRGTLLDGTEFDSSHKRGQPATFPVTGVIKGWTEALQLMKVGSKWQLFIPPDLAYGERGYGSQIGPNTLLTFEIELVSTTVPPPVPALAPQPVTSDIIKVPSAEELKKGAQIEVIKADQIPAKTDPAPKK